MIKLRNVRLSFPSLFRTEKFGTEDTGKYSATFILDPKEHAAELADIKAEIQRIMKEELKSKIPADKIALKSGDGTGRPEYAGKMVLKASTKRRPLVIDRDKTPLTEEDGKPYAGCYVNAIVTLWPQNNQFGKRINAGLEGVQFYAHGEPFGSAGIDVDAFDELEPENDPFAV